MSSFPTIDFAHQYVDYCGNYDGALTDGPQVPNRHNYILWLKDLLDTTVGNGDVTRKAVGLDIGTGASCIYPLLGCSQRPWSFIATGMAS